MITEHPKNVRGLESSTPLRKVAFLSDYVPRQCGIAAFSADLYAAISAQYPAVQYLVVSVSDRDYDYPPEVRFEIADRELQAYRRAADFLNLSETDVVSVQHEFGIFGGRAGSYLLATLSAVRMPVVTTLHTILRSPNANQRRVFEELLRLSTRLVAMTAKGAELLQDIYKVPNEKIDIIPHGVPDVSFVDPNFYKDHFGVEGRPVLLTFGLLAPNKGIENVLRALPEIVAEFSDVVYIILGATHPSFLRDQGETYRLSLERLAQKHGVSRNVIFFNRFVDAKELTEFMGAADVYITPYLDESQISSGTLAYGFGSGKAVISTPYWHAAELLADGRGVLVPFNDPPAIAEAVKNLLGNEAQRHAMRKSAYKMSREMVWPNVAQLYINSFERARQEQRPARPIIQAQTLDRGPGILPSAKYDHLLRMTDSAGILQHAIFTVPHFQHGYCTDDNARALILMMLLGELDEELPQYYEITGAYAGFLQEAFNPVQKRFRNFMSFNRQWLEEFGSEDSHCRALWALGTCVGRSRDNSIRTWASQLFEAAVEIVETFDAPRAWAFTILGLDEYLRALSGDRLANRLRESLGTRLLDCFHDVADPDWLWFENVVSYDNARISQALISTGRWMGRSDMLEIGLKTLRWLMQNQTAETGYFRPIGSNGFWKRGEAPARFDQQPVEANAALGGCLEAFGATGDDFWLQQARRAFEWYLGSNDLGTSMFDAQTGGCHDGLEIDRVNQNQGAESTLAFLLSLSEMRLSQNATAAFQSEKNV
jgi:glycosyltransferase involved in cell wall biosynthesis